MKNDEVVAAAQVLVRKLPFPFRSLAYIPRGPIVAADEQNDFLEAIARLVKRDYKAVALSIEPEALGDTLPKQWKASKNRILPAKTILLNLEKSEKELLDGMAKKTRQYIRKSAGDGVVIRRVRHNDDIADCLDIYYQTAKRAGFNLHSDQYYKDVQRLLGDHSPIFAAFVDDKPVAFLWLAISARTAFELYGGMNDEGQRRRANYALKWHVIKLMKDWGIERYDFGGLINDGVSTFKRSWTSEDTELPGTFDMPLSPLYGAWSSALPAGKKILQKLRRR